MAKRRQPKTDAQPEDQPNVPWGREALAVMMAQLRRLAAAWAISLDLKPDHDDQDDQDVAWVLAALVTAKDAGDRAALHVLSVAARGILKGHSKRGPRPSRTENLVELRRMMELRLRPALSPAAAAALEKKRGRRIRRRPLDAKEIAESFVAQLHGPGLYSELRAQAIRAGGHLDNDCPYDDLVRTVAEEFATLLEVDRRRTSGVLPDPELYIQRGLEAMGCDARWVRTLFKFMSMRTQRN